MFISEDTFEHSVETAIEINTWAKSGTQRAWPFTTSTSNNINTTTTDGSISSNINTGDISSGSSIHMLSSKNFEKFMDRSNRILNHRADSKKSMRADTYKLLVDFYKPLHKDLENLLGRKIENWSYLEDDSTTTLSKQEVDSSSSTIAQHLAVWQIGHSSLSTTSKALQDHNKNYFPAGTKFEILNVDDKDTDQYVKAISSDLEENGVDGAYEAYERIRVLEGRKELLQMMLLWKYGGWFIDSDIVIFETVHAWSDPSSDSLVIPNSYDQDGTSRIPNGILFCNSTKHPLFKYIIEQQVANIQNNFYGNSIHDATGTVFLENAFHNFATSKLSTGMARPRRDIKIIFEEKQIRYNLFGRTRWYHGMLYKMGNTIIGASDSSYKIAVNHIQDHIQLWHDKQWYCEISSACQIDTSTSSASSNARIEPKGFTANSAFSLDLHLQGMNFRLNKQNKEFDETFS